MQEFCMPEVCMEILEHDRISSLPDEVLTHILSFLSTKEAVYTCVLSKTWRKIWSTVPILNFNSCEFLMDEQDGDEGRRSEARFERFVRGVLDNRESTNLDIVHYSRQLHWSEAIVSMEWLDHVVRLMPQVIHIDIDGNFYEVDVPDLIFSCASLQHLSMSLDTGQLSNNIIRPVSINLPSLKFLELYWVELPDDFAEKLVNGCPSLEKLILCGCESKFSSISSEVLKELNWDGCYPYEKMQISCPNLVSLILRINLKSCGISLKNMSSLVNVDIRLYGYYVDYVPNLNLFCGISNATNLELHLNLPPKFKEQLEKDIPNCGNFNNLKKLIVVGKWNMSNDFYMIACLLKHSPNLKELHLLFDESQDQIQEHREDASRDVLYEYLETVKIGNEYGGKLSSKQINAMIRTLGSYVKKIGNLIMT